MQAEQQATLEVQRLTAEVQQIQERITRLQDDALIAAGDYADAQFAAALAEQVAVEARADLRLAEGELADAEQTVGQLARSSYMTGGQLSQDLLLLDSASPADLVERAGLMDALADFQVGVLRDVESVQRRESAAAERARAAELSRDETEADAAALLAQTTQQLEQARGEVEGLQVQLAEQQAQLAAAQALLGRDGAERASRDGDRQPQGGQGPGGPTVVGGWAVPLDGQITSGYGPRGGSFHYGVDIAAPMYTPIYSAGDGVVVQAGAASGFGQAIYIEHGNGDVTVYGHIETIFVSAGDRVVAGEEIAGVGNRGFSTGPHLHFEVQQGGVGGSRVDPIGWLADRGVYL